MTKIIRLLLFICYWQVFFLANSVSQDKSDSIDIDYDQSEIEIHHFSKNTIDDFKNDNDFDYGTKEPVNLKIWERIKRWFQNLLSKLFTLGVNSTIVKTIFYIFLGLVILYAILRLLNVDIKNILYGNTDSGNLAYDVIEENIHEMDFEDLIHKAIEAKEFRKAIRLFYLYALKKLTDQHLIDWQPGKTNHDYINELKEAPIKATFNDLSYYFEYVWYGDFKVNESIFLKTRNTFQELKQKISTLN